MKRVSIVLAVFFVSLIALPACDNQVDEIVADQPNAGKATAAENERDGDLWD